MSKFIAFTLMLAVALTLVYSSESLSFKTVNPFTVAILQDRILCTVSHEESIYKINIRTYDGSEVGECKLSVDPASEIITGRLRAVTLYKKIVIWGKRSEELVDNGKSRRTTYTVLLVDPYRCTHSSPPDLVDEVHISYPPLLPELMVHQDSFDIFFPSGRKCSPCSFDINGGQLWAIAQLQFEGMPTAPFYLKEIGFTRRYVYIYNDDKGPAGMRLLGQTFKDIISSRFEFNGTVSELVTSFTYTGDEDNAFVTLYQISDKSKKVTLVTVNKYGRILEDVDVAELELRKDYEVQSFYDEENQCIAVHELSHQRVTNVTCTRVKNLYGFSKNDSTKTKCLRK